MIKGTAGIVHKVFHFDYFFLCQRIRLCHKYINITGEKRDEFQIPLSQNLSNHIFIEIIFIDNAQLADLLSHILYNIYGPSFKNGKLIEIVFFVLPNQVNKGLYRKGIMLHGDTEFLLIRCSCKIFILHKLILLGYLPCIA